MNLGNLKIGRRLALGFGLIGFMLVFILGLSITMLGRINQGTTELVNERMPKLEMASDLQTQINDIAIALRNMMLNDDKADQRKQVEDIQAIRSKVKENIGILQRTLMSAKGQQLTQQLADANDKYEKGQEEIIRRVNAGSDNEAKAYLVNELRPVLAGYKQLIAEQLTLQRELAQQVATDAANTYSDTRLLMICLGIAIIAFAGFIAYLITASITRPVARALEVANTVAAGDLTSRIDISSRDEMGQLLQALKAMNESLVRTVGTVRSGTETIASASSQVAAGSQDLSARTEQQASSLEETASSMEELTSTVKQNAENARQANVLADVASTVARKGGDVISQVVGTMGEINSSAAKISDIIGVIDGIAFQTNILALNAAVEAARAGEQGRGFAVVATEVRSLAQRSANAAKEIKSLIVDSTAKVENGSALVNQAGATMQEIVDSVKRVTDIMAEIAAASQEQTAGIEQINQAVTQMDEVTQQNAALVEEAAAASESMQEQAAKLAQAVSVFKLDQAATVTVAARPATAAPKMAAMLPRAQAKAVSQAPRSARPVPVRQTTGDDWEEF